VQVQYWLGRPESELGQESIVGGVVSDPEPGHLIVVEEPDGPIAATDSNRTSAGRSRYAAQKRGVARDLTVSLG